MERNIVIGLITSTEYLQQLKEEWNPLYIESKAAKILASWCWEYFDKHDKAPMQNIENVLTKKLKKNKIKKGLAEEIETNILRDLNEQYQSTNLDLDVLLFDTREHFIERQLELHKEEIQVAIDSGNIQKAKELQDNFKFKIGGENVGIDLADSEIDAKIDEAFESNNQIVIKSAGALGKFWNDEMTRGSFVAFLAPEKRGKSYLLLELMMLAIEQEQEIGFFQAGDMTEGQQIIRTAIYLTQKSNKKKFCGKQYIPVLDCVKNQNDSCNRKIRASNFGIFDEKTDEEIRKEITYDELVEAKLSNKRYKNCYNCANWQNNPWGTVWLEDFDNGTTPLTAHQAKRAWKKHFVENNKVKLATFANGELTLIKLISTLEIWKRNGFKPKIILVDYADLIVGNAMKDMRHQIDAVWRGLRGISQKYDCLVAAPTQADAKAYEQELLRLGNFSEDKRKLAHVTAMYGLNQSPDGREKKLGILRINKIVIREDGFHQTDQVHVLQHLQIGQPNLGSFF